MPKARAIGWVTLALLAKEMLFNPLHYLEWGSARDASLPFWRSMDAITETQRDFDSFSDGHQKTRAYVNVGTDANGVKFLMKPGQMNLSTDWVAVSQ